MGKASRKKYLQRQQKQYGGIKLSAALIELCEPFEPEKLSTEEFSNLIGLAAMAWNIAELPKEERLESLTAFIDTIPSMKEELKAEIDTVLHDDTKDSDFAPATTMLHFIGAMIQRKDELFPNDDRIVVNYNVKDNPEGPYLTVSSTHKPLTC
jgi:hypothetical protein